MGHESRNGALLDALRDARDALYNGFEPDNQSYAWHRADAAVKAGESARSETKATFSCGICNQPIVDKPTTEAEEWEYLPGVGRHHIRCKAPLSASAPLDGTIMEQIDRFLSRVGEFGPIELSDHAYKIKDSPVYRAFRDGVPRIALTAGYYLEKSSMGPWKMKGDQDQFIRCLNEFETELVDGALASRSSTAPTEAELMDVACRIRAECAHFAWGDVETERCVELIRLFVSARSRNRAHQRAEALPVLHQRQPGDSRYLLRPDLRGMRQEDGEMILSWTCTFCRWMNDNNNGPCRRCGGHTEMKMVKGKWKEVTIKEPNREPSAATDRTAKNG